MTSDVSIDMFGVAICIKSSQNRFQKNHSFIVGKKYQYKSAKKPGEMRYYMLVNEKGRKILFNEIWFNQFFKDLREVRTYMLEELGI